MEVVKRLTISEYPSGLRVIATKIEYCSRRELSRLSFYLSRVSNTLHAKTILIIIFNVIQTYETYNATKLLFFYVFLG